MNDSIRRILIMHGGIVTSVGALSGLFYSLAISGDMPGSVQAWHLAHLQGILTGLLIIAVSSCVSHIRLDAGKSLVMAVASLLPVTVMRLVPSGVPCSVFAASSPKCPLPTSSCSFPTRWQAFQCLQGLAYWSSVHGGSEQKKYKMKIPCNACRSALGR